MAEIIYEKIKLFALFYHARFPFAYFVNLVNLSFQEELHTFSIKNIDFCEFFSF